MQGSDRVARILGDAEDRLRAEGMTGARAFEVLVGAIRARLGDPVDAEPVAVRAVADLPLGGGVDLLGLAYERFFADLFKGRRGQYFTPPPLIRLLLERAGVGPGDAVLDPTCGSGAFLVEAARRGATVRGIERDPLLARLARLNLRLAGVGGSRGQGSRFAPPVLVRQADFFATEPAPVDVVVANPPFSVEITEREVLDRYEIGRGRDRVVSDWLFVEAIERWVGPGGRAALVLPWSILSNPSTAPLRSRIDAAWQREAVCTLPEGVFRPFGGAAGRAVLLWLVRRPAPAVVPQWGELEDPGYDPRSEHLRRTSDAEVDALVAGEGWRDLEDGGWTPAAGSLEVSTRPLGDLAVVRRERSRPAQEAPVVDLVEFADADKATGEVPAPRRVAGDEVRGHKAVLADGDVLVARMRPSLGNVAVVYRPDPDVPLVGSTEWIVLEVGEHPHWVLHALRTPAWREALPVTSGQTRPRTSAEDVVVSEVPWPGDEVAGRVDALSRSLHEQRADLRRRLDALQQAVDAYAGGRLDAAGLAAVVGDLDGA